MTYFTFLLLFFAPLVALAFFLALRDHRRITQLAAYAARGSALPTVLLAHVLAAVIYTTPWDNYLVATSVWSYNPALVTGVTIGWVPIEEYHLLRAAESGHGAAVRLAGQTDKRVQGIEPTSTLALRSGAWRRTGWLWPQSWPPGTSPALT